MNYEVMALRIILEWTQTAAERNPQRKPRDLGGDREEQEMAQESSGVLHPAGIYARQ